MASFEALADRRSFECGLKTRPIAATRRLTLHHIRHLEPTRLSTSGEQPRAQFVDKIESVPPRAAWSLGLIVPKRHARRAVTRNTIRRLVKASFQHRLSTPASMVPGVWLVRMRAPFETERQGAATSAPLRAEIRAEVQELLSRVRVTERPRGRIGLPPTADIRNE